MSVSHFLFAMWIKGCAVSFMMNQSRGKARDRPTLERSPRGPGRAPRDHRSSSDYLEQGSGMSRKAVNLAAT
jgi:hypothetical protein